MPQLTGAVVPRSSIPAMSYPGRVIKRGEKNKDIVRAIQRRLNESGVGPIEEDGDFGKNTYGAVRLFQARFPDADGQPLKVDGEVGSITWATLFGVRSVPAVTTPKESPLLTKVLEVAVSQIGVTERPLGSNRGPQVDKYLRSVGLDPARGSYAWCVAFIYYCFEQAAQELGIANPMVKTAGVLDHWNKAGSRRIPRITRTEAVNNPALVKPGHLFVMDFGGGHGHTGIVERVVGGKLVTIEGNTNAGGSREGIGVYRRDMRKIADINKGFIDYSGF